MTDAYFLRTIIADPLNDDPRKIYADWLDENGQPERSEFIRVQIELARTPKEIDSVIDWVDGSTSVGKVPNLHFVALRRRERELLKAHDADWVAEFHSEIGWVTQFDRVLFHRGLIGIIECDWRMWQQHADALRRAAPIERVRLTDVPDWDLWSMTEIKEHLEKLYGPIPGVCGGVEFELPVDAERAWHEAMMR